MGRPSNAIEQLKTELINKALEIGASAAELISPADIKVEDRLARLCLQPRCPNYGQSVSCPPNVGGPEELRKILARAVGVLVVKLDVPSDVLLSTDNKDVFILLHEIAAGVEILAKEKGLGGSTALVGGSCKRLFCEEQPDCAVIARAEPCRNPDQARPSMSGFGVNVDKMMKAAGWSMTWVAYGLSSEESRMSSICGMVALAE